MASFDPHSGARRRGDIDTIRAIACIALVSFHVVGAGPNAGLHVAPDHWLAVLNQTFIDMRMPLFSFISGFVFVALAPKQSLFLPVSQRGTIGRGAGKMLRAKARRLLLPMLVVGALFWTLRSLMVGPQVPLWQIAVLPYAHYWYLQATFLLMALVIGAVALVDRPEAAQALRARRERRVGAVLLALVLAVWIFGPRAGINLFSVNNALYIGPFFLAGFLLARLPRAQMALMGGGGARRGLGAAVLTLSVLAGFALAREFVVLDGALRRAMTVLLGAGACAGLLLLRPQNGLMARLGRASYAIYLFHVFFTAAARMAMEALWPDIAPGLVWPVALCAGLLGPLAVQQALLLHRWSAWAGLGLRLRARPSKAALPPAASVAPPPYTPPHIPAQC